MAEIDDAVEVARRRRDDEERGKSLDSGRHLAIAPYGIAHEKKIMELPVWIGSKQPLQNPDGSFPFMPDYDSLDEVPL